MTGTSTEFVEIPGLDGVTVVRHSGGSPTDARHQHESLCLGAVLAGERTVIVDGASHTATAGEVLIIGPRRVHTCPDRGTSQYVMLSIPPQWFEQYGLIPAVPPTPVVDDPVLFGRITALADRTLEPGSAMESEDALLALLDSLCREGVSADIAPPEPNRIRRVRHHMENRFAEDLRLDKLAALAGCSPCRLNRTFARTMGMPPHEYQSMLRVREVKRLIREGAGLTEAALQAGFFDQSHMTRCFKKTMGMTPGKYARGLLRPPTP